VTAARARGRGRVASALGAVALAGLAPAAPQTASAAPGPAARVLRYETRVAIDMDEKSVRGETRILVRRPAGAPEEIRFPRNGLAVEGLSVGGSAVAAMPSETELVVPLPETPGEVWVAVAYSARPRRGLVFGERHVYTDFFTCHWMVCREEPGEKARFSLEIDVPESFEVVASGRRASRRETAPGRRLERWVEEVPQASYLYGFAAGQMARAGETADGTELAFLGVGETPDSLARKLEPTAAMLRFFTEKAGVPLPGGLYTQVVVPDPEAQEKSSFSILGRPQLDPILEDPQEDWVIAHELAHQWWGNSITCRDWSHFWLNEGLTSFMVAAFKEARWGRVAYEREIGLFEARRREAAEAGWDRPLAWAGEYPSLRTRRAIQYSKGALFLHTLRGAVGDAAFWRGLRAYTRAHLGGSVESGDLRRAFETETGADLSELFADWVDAAPASP